MMIIIALALASPEISMAEAVALSTAAITACQKKGQAVSASVVDAQGVPIAALRGDGNSKPPSAASRKAATAVAFGKAGSEMESRVKTDPSFASLMDAHKDIYNPDGGSLPLYRDGHIIGGLAVAYTSHTVADACAREALESHPLRKDGEVSTKDE